MLRFGRHTVRGWARKGLVTRAYDTKRALKSPAWTTRISDIPVAR